MEEPDVDELTWMAMDEQFTGEPAYEDVVDAELVSSRADKGSNESEKVEISRKRAFSESSLAFDDQDSIATDKRCRVLFEEIPPGTTPVPISLTSKSCDRYREESEHEEFDSGLPENNYGVRRMANCFSEHIAITAPSGVRVYADRKQSSESSVRPSYRQRVTPSSINEGLLVQSIDTMMEVAHQERMHKLLSKDHSSIADIEDTIDEAGSAHEKPWVDKYAPRSFTDLLSEELTNREVLRWMKQWDPIVFGHLDNLPTSEEVLAALNTEGHGRNSFGKYRRNQWRRWRSSEDGENLGYRQEFSEDSSFSESWKKSTTESIFQKVLLLCGPPGLGKTTLAHIVAKHCGYRVVEINASDDRAASSLKEKVFEAVQMKSVSGDRRPNCLVIDEIDGVLGGSETRGALRHLIELITRKKRGSETETEEKSEKSNALKRRSKKTEGPEFQTLVRPIICICNDLYAPALRPLRQVARAHAFDKPSIHKMVARLKFICEEEGLRTSTRVLTTLAEHTECDIRACLNTLQFLKRKGKHLLSLDAEALKLGYKDMTTNVFDIWTEGNKNMLMTSNVFVANTFLDRFFTCHTFDVRDCSRSTKSKGRTGEGSSHSLKQFTRLYDLLAGHGDHDLVMEGLHENLPQVRYQDPNLFKTVECLRCICDSDVRNKRVVSKQQYFMNDPPINGMIIFKGYKTPHRQLSVNVQRLLRHKVEQEKLKVEDTRERHANKTSQTSRELSVTRSVTNSDASDPQRSFEEVPSKRQEAEAKSTDLKDPTTYGPLKPRPIEKANRQVTIFERLKSSRHSFKESAQSSSTRERDSKPLFYKFHEGFTNAIRRPLLLRELL